MKFLTLILMGVIYHPQIINGQQLTKRVICYYDAFNTTQLDYSTPFEKRLAKALPKCTHLVYSYIQILPKTFELRNFNFSLKPINLKIQFPHLKIFLSVGGDKLKLSQQYLRFLEAEDKQQLHFIENVKSFLKSNSFDGLDLAFPLPRNKPRSVHSGLDRIFKNVKKIFTGNEVIDANAATHKMQYTKFVQVLGKELGKAKLQLSMTVLPNVNSTWYFDIFKIHKHFEFINIFAFDFLTPRKNPEEADYTAPIYFKEGSNRLHHYNIEFQVDYWINNGCPVNKLNLGISTYGRAWRLSTNSGLSGVPVVESTNGGADPGKLSKTAGLLSWPEICIKLATKGLLHKVIDKEHKYGNYAFRPADRNDNNGIWISFDDPDFAGIKAEYVMQKGMGGMAVYDLHHDDYQKFCMGPVFPILKRISKSLGVLQQILTQYLKGDPATINKRARLKLKPLNVKGSLNYRIKNYF